MSPALHSESTLLRTLVCPAALYKQIGIAALAPCAKKNSVIHSATLATAQNNGSQYVERIDRNRRSLTKSL